MVIIGERERNGFELCFCFRFLEKKVDVCCIFLSNKGSTMSESTLGVV